MLLLSAREHAACTEQQKGIVNGVVDVRRDAEGVEMQKAALIYTSNEMGGGGECSRVPSPRKCVCAPESA